MIARLPLAMALGVLGSWACGAADLGVRSYPQPEGSPAEVVTFPPPPAQIEHLDAKPPAKGCLWADGQWVWATQHWNWRPGGWVRPPEGCHYSAPTLQWAPSGETSSGETTVLYYRPGRWYSVEEPRLCPDPVSCPDQSPVRSNPTMVNSSSDTSSHGVAIATEAAPRS
jgi:hypothetical protein